MYLSYLLIDVGADPDRPRPGRLWLRNIYHVHQRLCMAFPSSTQKENDPDFLKPYKPSGFQHVHGERTAEQAFLFRIDPQPGGSPVIIVQSAIEPDWGYAFHNADYLLAAKPECKEFNPNIDTGRSYQFRLLANPVRKISKKSLGADGKPLDIKWVGKRVPVPKDKLEEWIIRKAENSGFHVEHLTNIQAGYVYVGKKGEDDGNRRFSARYEGIIKVTDPDKFRDALVMGIGPGKAFGFGLLSVARV